jgi:hypothetical protein
MNRYYSYSGSEDPWTWHAVSDGYIIDYEPAFKILGIWGFGEKENFRFKLTENTRIVQEETGTRNDPRGFIVLADPQFGRERCYFVFEGVDLFIKEIKRELSRYR